LTVFQRKEVEWGINTGLYYGLSSDSRPTENIVKGSIFTEIDTGKRFIYSGTTWIELLGQGKTYREAMAETKRAWIESIFVQTGEGNDWDAEIGTTFTTLNKIYDPVTIAGTHTLAVVANKGFTGKTNTIYEVEITTAGSKTTAKYKWRKQTYLGQVWGDYVENQTAGPTKTLADGVQINFNDDNGYEVGDKWILQACGSWHTPENGSKSFLTSIHIHLYDSDKKAQAGKIRVYNDIYRIWDLYDTEVNFIDWRTPIYLLGNGTRQFKVEFAEATSADIEYAYLTLKGWDEVA